VNDASAHHVIGIRIDALQKLHAKARQFVLRSWQIEWKLGLENFLSALLLSKMK
jgi:hypothetical protein